MAAVVNEIIVPVAGVLLSILMLTMPGTMDKVLGTALLLCTLLYVYMGVRERRKRT